MLDRLAMIGVIELGGDEVEEGGEADAGGEGTADEIDLSAEQRTEIDYLTDAMATADYYLLLGIERTARPAEIKKAYYKLAPRYHPDRYFGKELGAYKIKIEQIFAALTKAHDTLRYPKRRASYDAALPPLKPGDRIRRSIHPVAREAEPAPSDPGRVSQPGPAPGDRVSSPGAAPAPGRASHVPAEPERQSAVPGRQSAVPGRQSAVPGRQSAVPGRQSAVPGRQSAVPRRQSSSAPQARDSVPSDPGVPPPRPPADTIPDVRPTRRKRFRRARPSAAPAARDPEAERLHKEALARKLAGNKIDAVRKGGRHAKEARVTQLEEGTFKQADAVRKSAAEVFRERYAKLADSAKQKRLEKYLEQGETAMDSGDYRTAAAAFQQALKLSPEDEEVQEKLETATSLALRQ
jgi:curved DNA-binding protein CbpA